MLNEILNENSNDSCEKTYYATYLKNINVFFFSKLCDSNKLNIICFYFITRTSDILSKKNFMSMYSFRFWKFLCLQTINSHYQLQIFCRFNEMFQLYRTFQKKLVENSYWNIFNYQINFKQCFLVSISWFSPGKTRAVVLHKIKIRKKSFSKFCFV